MPAAHVVGRVGGLAVALGVGAAVLGFCGVAAADNSTGGTTESAHDTGPVRSGSTVARTGPKAKARSSVVARQTRPVPSVPSDVASDLAVAALARRDDAVGSSITTRPDVVWEDGILRGTLGATSTDGLPLNYTVVDRPNLGGKITFADVHPEGQFSYLPYMSTVTDPAVDEKFSIMVSETTAFTTFLSNIPVVGLFVPGVLQSLYQIPVLSEWLSPWIGDSQIVDFVENAAVLADGKPVAFTYRMPSFDGTPISVNYFPAVNVSQGSVSAAPIVLDGAGLGSPGVTNPDSIWESPELTDYPPLFIGVEPLRTDSTPGGYSGGGGYNVITWDSRGKGDSGGFMQMNNPFWEGRDVSAIISWAVSNGNPAANQIAMEAVGDPLLGMVGGSYGGGIQVVAAGIPDRRIDGITPWISWNSLNDSLYPRSTFKSAWSTVLLLDLVLGAARVNSQVYSGLLFGDIFGFLTESSQAALAASGPTMLVNNIEIPTFLIQGTTDTLFSLDQAISNAEQIMTANPDVPVKMSWFCGGHALCQDPRAGQDERNLADNLKWLDQYVAGNGTPADTIPDFQWVDQTGHYYASDLMPFEAGFNNVTPLSYQSGGGRLGIVPIIGGSGPTPTILGEVQTLISLTSGSPARNAINMAVAPPTGTRVAGSPTLSFTYNGLGTSRAVYAQLVDNATGRVVGNIVTPVPVTLDGRQHTVEIPMENIAYTVYQPSDSLTLQITSSATAFETWTAFGLIDISDIQLDVPTVAG